MTLKRPLCMTPATAAGRQRTEHPGGSEAGVAGVSDAVLARARLDPAVHRTRRSQRRPRRNPAQVQKAV